MLRLLGDWEQSYWLDASTVQLIASLKTADTVVNAIDTLFNHHVMVIYRYEAFEKTYIGVRMFLLVFT